MDTLTPKEEAAAITSYAELRKLREQAQREGFEGKRVDAANKCKCDRCGQVHFVRREKQ